MEKRYPTLPCTLLGFGGAVKKERVKWAVKELKRGRSTAQVASDAFVHPNTLRRWVRNYERYGDSLWTDYPKEVERE